MLLPNIGAQNQQLNDAYAQQLLALNNDSDKNNIILSEEDAKHIVLARSNTLTSYGRIELSINVTKEIIKLFQSSGFVNNENYVEIITEIQEIFYYFKNETNEKVGDIDLLNKLKYFFELECGGSIQLLKSKMEYYARDVRKNQYKLELEDEGKDIFEKK